MKGGPMDGITDNSFSISNKRMILVADDEMINRELLSGILKSDYEVIFAEDGNQALSKIYEYKDTLSLVLLDILMPGKTGIDVLKEVKADPTVARIPIIVVTSESTAEVESLKLGAVDFIPKPYPAPGVIQARVSRTIELTEGKDLIRFTERDSLTGLYNKDYFYHYAKQFDQFNRNVDMDAIIVDVNHFRMINERYGNTYGDEVLRRIGEKLKEMVHDDGGIVCRKEADTFMVYCPHREDYKKILENASVGLGGEESSDNRVRLRMGVYSDVDKALDMERRFDHAKTAADTVKNSFSKTIGYYDNELHERELYAEQLIEDFPKALAEDQFKVYYQPKFDVTSDVPLLVSAEALVRWIHPDLGMISPGVFIPLFEENGLIERLDNYVWRQTAKQVAIWKKNYDYAIPVSVNVSRIDMYDPQLTDILKTILDEEGLDCKDLILEVTESAYTEDSKQIIEMVEGLRSIGFRIEMDDFGTGYSSLNMISNLPIDALKLDMQFVRNAFREGGNTRMLEVIIDIADFLKVPVIAEGVETEQQLDALRKLGCDVVQGYFFSKPVPAAEFEPFILQKKEAEKTIAEKEADMEAKLKEAKIFAASGRSNISQIDSHVTDKQEESSGVELRKVNIVFVAVAFVLALLLLRLDKEVAGGYERMNEASDRFLSAQNAASDMMNASDYLTDRVRCFVMTGDLQYLNDFFEEVEVTRRRDNAVRDLEDLLEGKDNIALENLNITLQLSNELVDKEYQAMRLILESGDYDMSKVPEKFANITLAPEDLQMSPDQQRQKARTLVFDNNYMQYKERIRENVSLCTQALIHASSDELQKASSWLSLLMRLRMAATVLFLITVLAYVIMIALQVRKPLAKMVSLIREQKDIEPSGVKELQFVARTYNSMIKATRSTQDALSYEATHDPLTGLFNRGAYNMLIESVDTEHMALLIVDVDHFKQVNDTYGHDMGDRVLIRVAEILKHSFRSVDIICRFGGDEFVVVMTRVNSSMKQLVSNKIDRANEILSHPEDDLPVISLSVGVAFSDRENPQGDIFKDADLALYRVKEEGRSGCSFYEG